MSSDNNTTNTNKRPLDSSSNCDEESKAKRRDTLARKFLLASSVKDVLRSEEFRYVITLQHNDTVMNALNTLHHEHIISAPVVLGASLEDNDTGTYMGMFDFSMVLKRLLRALDDEQDQQQASSKQRMIPTNDVMKCVTEKVLNMKLISLAGDDAGLVYQASTDTSLLDLLNRVFLHADGTHVHRVALFDASGNPTAIVSQSDVVRYLHKNMQHFPRLCERKLVDMDVGSVDVVTVVKNTPAIVAFQKMKGWKVRSLCIVDEHGHAVDTLSLTDLRGITHEHFEKLFESVIDFKPSNKAQLVTVQPDASFGELINVFERTGMHTVFSLDHHKKPLRIITLTDVIRAVVEE